MRRLLVTTALLMSACALEASVQKPVRITPPVVQVPVADQKLKVPALKTYRRAIQGKAPLTAAPADGISFYNEFLGDQNVRPNQSVPEKTATK